MTRTTQLELPLVLPAQAQKHVTVNEALARLDAVTQLCIDSSVLSAPPASVVEGNAYLVPDGAIGEWAGASRKVAVWSNGGWLFLQPRPGWRAWDQGRGSFQIFDGEGWSQDAVAVSAHGSGLGLRVMEFDHTVTAGPSNITAPVVPAQSLVIGVTGRVVSGLTGSGLTGWRIGVAGSDNRYGSGLGTGLNSHLIGLSGAPVAYYAATPLLITAEGGSFSGGAIRLAVHIATLQPPRPV